MIAADLLWAALAAALCAAAAVLCAWILRGAGLSGGRPAAAVVGGVMGGLLLGGAVLGRVAPGWHERIYLGGVQERAALRAAVREDRAELAGMRAAGLPEDSIEQARSAGQAARAPLRAALIAAASRREQAHRAAALLLVAAAAFVAGGASCSRPRQRPRRPNRGDPPARGAIAAALLFTAIPCAATVAILRLLTDIDPAVALAAGGATGCGSMLLVPGRWTPSVGRQRAVWTVGAIALGLGAATMLTAAAWARSEGGAISAPAAVFVPLAWVAGALGGRALLRAPRTHRLLKRAFLTLLAPAAVAIAAVHLDIHLLASAGASGWAAILGLLLAIVAAGDGRWVGAYAGWRVLPGRPRGSLMDIATETIGAGALLTQAVAAAWLYAIGFFPADDPAGALALAALLASPVAIEPLIVAYRAAAAKLSETRP